MRSENSKNLLTWEQWRICFEATFGKTSVRPFYGHKEISVKHKFEFPDTTNQWYKRLQGQDTKLITKNNAKNHLVPKSTDFLASFTTGRLHNYA